MNISRNGLDRKFSEYIRLRASFNCERCNRTTGKMECSHYHGRRSQSVRFDPENAACLCFQCHRFFTENPSAHHSWFLKRLGEAKYNALLVKRNTPGKPDYALLNIWLTAAINDLIANPTKNKWIMRNGQAEIYY